MLTFHDIQTNPDIRTFIRAADDSLAALGYTEHSFAHVGTVADRVAYILGELGKSERTVELGRIAAFLHDIGNLVNRAGHSQSGAVMAFAILTRLGMDAVEIAEITTAIGNHDEGTGVPVSELAAALILSDKSDVRRSRVRKADDLEADIHDRVNYSVLESALTVDKSLMHLTLSLCVDESIGTVSDYFEIFLERMLLCRRAAERLGLKFRLLINKRQMM